MPFLPIVERELRVGARRPFTYWSRLAAAAFALLILVAMYALAEVSKGAIFTAGQAQFAVLKWLSFIFACSAGVFLTADTVSEEKREGTLGLLFLTDLRGHDVVLGKLISSSVTAFYGFLAVFPTLALTMMFGGVTVGEFWRMVLIISNTLFVSISAGLLVSSMSRDAVKAINGALLVIVLLLGGLPLADFILAAGDIMKFHPVLSLASPAYLFWSAGPLLPRDYWLCVGLQHALGWMMLIFCSVCVPRTWQQRTSRTGVHRWNWLRGGSGASGSGRRLLDKNPVLWLAVQDRWLRWLVWVLVLAAVGQFSWAVIETARSSQTPMPMGPARVAVGSPSTASTRTVTTTNGTTTVMFTTSTSTRIATSRFAVSTISWLLALGFKIWVALQACRFFIEAIRSGTLELILVSPVGPAEIVKGQARALLRIFLVPALLLLLMQVTVGIQGILEMRHSLGGVRSMPIGSFDIVFMQVVSLTAGIMNSITVLLALGWFGMWMGVTTRKVPVAVLKTVGFVIVLPVLGLTFASGMFFAMMMAASTFGRFPFWVAPLLYCGLNSAKDLAFIFWSRNQLFTRFREMAAQEARAVTLSPWPPVVAAKEAAIAQ